MALYGLVFFKVCVYFFNNIKSFNYKRKSEEEKMKVLFTVDLKNI